MKESTVAVCTISKSVENPSKLLESSEELPEEVDVSIRFLSAFFTFTISLFAQVVGSDFLKIEKDRITITDEAKFVGYIKSIDDGELLARYKEILKPIELQRDEDNRLLAVGSYEEAFKNLRYIYSRLYLKEKPQNIDRQLAALNQKSSELVHLLLSLQNKNLYYTDVVPIVIEYRKVERKVLELELQRENLKKIKEALTEKIVSENLRFDGNDIDYKSKIKELGQELARLKEEAKRAKSDSEKERILLSSSIVSIKQKSYEIKSDFFEKIRLLKTIKSKKEDDRAKREFDELLAKTYAPILFDKDAVSSPSNEKLFLKYKEATESFQILKDEALLDNQVFKKAFRPHDDSPLSKTGSYLDDVYTNSIRLLDTTLFVSNNIDIKVKTVLLMAFWALLVYFLKLFLTKRVIPSYFDRVYKDGGHSEHIRFILSQIVTVAAYTVIFFLILSGFGLSLTNFAIIVSALSVGIGFGLQGVVSNFVSGIILLFENSLKIGDIIQLEDGRLGVVTSVNLRTTNIRTFDDIDILIPNASVFSGKIENLTKESSVVRRRVHLTVGYDTDIKKLKEILDKKTKELMGEFFIEPTKLLVSGYGANGLEIEYRVFVDLKKASIEVGDFLKEFLNALRKEGIEIPYPKLEIVKFEGSIK